MYDTQALIPVTVAGNVLLKLHFFLPPSLPLNRLNLRHLPMQNVVFKCQNGKTISSGHAPSSF